ncbi:MAG: hypothetical protein V4691_03235 [Pseudomonadota bacterium]
MKILLSFFSLIFTVSLACAETKDRLVHAKEGSVEFAIPATSPVQEFSFNDEYGSSIRFKGSFVLTGTYLYGYFRGNVDGDGVLFFMPDKASAATLPYWHDRGPIEEISFINPEKFVKDVIPAAALGKLKNKSAMTVTGKTTILVDTYEASIDCDTPTYSVNFISVQENRKFIASRSQIDDDGC